MKYRKKPVVVEAVQWNGANKLEIFDLARHSLHDISFCGDQIGVRTLEGVMTASLGDYIIRGVNGELYPCKPDIFAKTYEKVEK